MSGSHGRDIRIGVTLACLCLLGGILAPGCGGAKRTNIVLIVIDTLRADHLSCYGYAENTSPFIDDIASKGILFERSYSASSWTPPSMASMHTSLYPFQHGVVTGFVETQKAKEVNPTITLNRIPDEATTLAEVLSQAGYRTFALADNLNICHEEGFDQGFDKFKCYRYRTAEVINKELVDWKGEIQRSSPYFLYLHYNDPHRPYHRRLEWYDRDPGRTRTMISDYDSEISYVDAKIGEMFDLFGWDKNTIVIITADHGEEFFEHGESQHGKDLYVETIHVPLIIYSPKHFQRPSRITEPVSTIDVLPTIRDLAGLPASDTDEGVSLVPLADGDEAAPRDRFLLLHLVRIKESWRQDLLSRAVIHGDWHYIVNVPYSEEIYNMKFDPEENDNRIEQMRPDAEKLKAYLDEFEASCSKFQQVNVEVPLNDELIKDMKSLGYFH
jgi:arylsulfatase A-like enzyme